MEAEKENLRRSLSTLLQSLPKISSEKDVRKAFREQERVNVNTMIDKVSMVKKESHNFIEIFIKIDAGNLYNFLRFQCRDICDVYKNDGEIKVQRIDPAVTEEPKIPKSHKKKNKNTAPKLK